MKPDAMAFDAVNILKDIRLFEDLTKEQLHTLNRGLVEKKFKVGDFIMKKGQKGTTFYIITSGQCEVLNAELQKVATLTEEDYFGEQALLRETTRNASIRATKPTVTLECSKETFQKVIANNVAFVRREAKRRAVITALKPNGQDLGPAPTEKTQEQRDWLFNMVEDNVMFMHLTDEQRYVVVDQMYLEEVAAGVDLITQGEVDAQTFYVVNEGSFDVYVNNNKSGTIPAGGCFGELALMYKAPRAATVRANMDSVVWTVRRNAFRNALAQHGKQQLSQNLKFLKTVKLLKPLHAYELALIDDALESKKYKEGAVILKQGDAPKNFYIIKSGRAAWLKKAPEKEDEKGTLEAGSYFGELALMNNERRAATVTAASDLVCLEMDRNHFTQLLGPLKEIMARKAKVIYAAKSPDDEGENVKGKVSTPLNAFKTIGVLGKGAFGLVSLVYDPSSKESYALKAIKKSQIVELGQQSHIINEKKVMEKMNCPFLVNLRGTYKDKYRVYFLLDVCLGGELFTILRRRRYFNEPTSKFYAGCVVEAFDYMHSKHIIYRDLKPENLVLDSKGFLKVTDFGFAKEVVDKTFTLCGTPDYLAPEIVTGQGHGKGVDWWTLGILIYEMLASFPPFFDDEPIETYRKIIKCRIKFPRYFTTESKELIKSLLRAKATKRLGVIKGGAKNIRAHPWFNNFSWEGLTTFKLTPPIVPTVKDPTDISNFDSFKDEDHEKKISVDPKEDFDHEF